MFPNQRPSESGQASSFEIFSHSHISYAHSCPCRAVALCQVRFFCLCLGFAARRAGKVPGLTHINTGCVSLYACALGILTQQYRKNVKLPSWKRRNISAPSLSFAYPFTSNVVSADITSLLPGAAARAEPLSTVFVRVCDHSSMQYIRFHNIITIIIVISLSVLWADELLP